MANLIECPDCGRDVSPRAIACPGCGCGIAPSPPPPPPPGGARPCVHCRQLVAPSAKRCPHCGGKDPYPIQMGCASTLFALAVVVALAVWAYTSGGGSGSGRAPLQAGVSAILRAPGGGALPAASTRADFDRYIELAGADDTTGMSMMRLAGRAFTLDAGTRCKIISTGVVCEVRIEDGRHAGRSMYVSRQHVQAIAAQPDSRE